MTVTTMSQAPQRLVRVPIAAAEIMLRDGGQEPTIYLPGADTERPILYRRDRSSAASPNYDRLRSAGVPAVFVDSRELEQHESLLEEKLAGVIGSSQTAPAEKAQLVHCIGTNIAHDLAQSAEQGLDTTRAETLIEHVIDVVLHDPKVAAHILAMAGHEKTVASHMFVVSALAVMLGSRVFGPDKRVLIDLGFAGMAHDLGKLSIDPAILQKPGALTTEEQRQIQMHPIESVRLMGEDPSATPAVRQYVLQHHEWLNGCGYPLGLGNDDVYPGSRVLAIVDSFHAMIGRRAYRAPMTARDANHALSAQVGRQFDADYVRCWLDLFDQHAQTAPHAAADSIASESAAYDDRNEQSPKLRRNTHWSARPRRFGVSVRLSVSCSYAERLFDATCAPDVFLAEIVDLSTGGLCLRSEHPVYPSEVLHIELPTHPTSTWVACQVAWCRSDVDARFRLGVRFVERISTPRTTNGENATWKQDLPWGDGLFVAAPGDHESARSYLSTLACVRPIPPSARDTLVELSKSEDASVRDKAAKLLGQVLPSPSAV